MRLLALLLASAAAVQGYWMADIAHQGKAPFNTNSTYAVFRNVKNYGAKGDGSTDDTKAINAAIQDGHRCGGSNVSPACVGSTTTPAVIYFPQGTYIVSDSIIMYYYTQLIGDPNNMPTIKGAAGFNPSSLGLVDSNKYGANGLSFKAQNVFFRQVRNFVFDTTAIPASVGAMGIHWPSSQATSLQNLIFKLNADANTQHTGIFMEEGSGGFITDITVYGGRYGAQFGNQQYTMRNLAFHGCQVAINQLWSWGWTYKSVTVDQCQIGINMTAPAVGSITVLDSAFTNTQVAFNTNGIPQSQANKSEGNLVFENTSFQNVGTIVKAPSSTLVPGTSSVTNFAMGNLYAPNGPVVYRGSDSVYFPAPKALKDGNKYYERSKPQYESTPASSFLSAKTLGAKGDGSTDDTNTLRTLFLQAAAGYSAGAVAFLDAGYYLVTDTIYIPPNVRIVGEGMAAVILASGAKFSNINSPYPVVQVGKPGESGYIEWSDTIVSTKGATAGAVLIEYNLATPIASRCNSGSPPSGMWDVHVRVGGFAGSNLQKTQCPITPTQANYVNPNCIAAYMSMHITPSANNLYMENVWLWIADHDIEDATYTQVSIFAGRGLLIESTKGSIWLVGTSVEHHTLYQYQLVNTKNIWMGQIQTETPYYQPNPLAPAPFTTRNVALSDPDFTADCQGVTLAAPCAMAWGLRVLGSKDIVIYGAGVYNFFNNYDTTCSNNGKENCQARIAWFGPAKGDVGGGTGFSATGTSALTYGVDAYNFNTIGSISMITRDGKDVAKFSDNVAGFSDGVAVFRY